MENAKFKVYIDDNFHCMQEDYRCEHGEYNTYEEAVEECKKIIEKNFKYYYKPGASAEEMLENYKFQGDDPFVVPEPEGKHFSAWDYADRRAEELANPVQSLF